MEIKEEVKREWFHAVLYDNCNLTSEYTKAFKEKYPQEYFYLHSFYRLRSVLKKDIDLMLLCGHVQWFTLTFNNERDKSMISSKRKSATRFLNDLFVIYEMVEEFGEDNGRYHIHGFGVYREGKGFNDFRRWSSRCKIQDLSKESLHKKVKYLTKYAVKDLPRRRRSKSLVFLEKKYQTIKGLRYSFPNCFKCRFNNLFCRVSFRCYNESSKEDNNPIA